MSGAKPNQSSKSGRLQLIVFLSVLALLALLYFSGLAPDGAKIEHLLQNLNDSSWSLPATILVFVVLGLVGTPQFLLIAASIFVFGPILGSLYSWIGTMISASLHFWLGRLAGADTLQRFAGAQINKIVEFVSKNGFWSSLLVRVVPSGPFILVNLALGVSRAKFGQFAIGTSLGILPKILVLAFVGQGMLSWAGQNNFFLILLFFGLAAAVFVIIWLLRRAWKDKRKRLS